MIVSRINKENYIYFNLHAEEIIHSNFIEDNNIGIKDGRIQISTINKVFESITKQDNDVKNIILDFNHLVACQSNLNKKLFELRSLNFNLLFLNLDGDLCNELGLNVIKNSLNILYEGKYRKYYLFENELKSFTDLDIDENAIFYELFLNKLKNFLETNSKPHTSSNVYLTSYVDMKKMLSYEKELILYALYRLSMRIFAEWNRELTQSPILICQSLNSAYLVSILSTFLKLDILILDKIGPINKLYNRLGSTIEQNRKYIVVSDLVCLGTEVKIVKNIVQFMGGQYLGNVSIIKVQTINKMHIKRKDATIASFSIKKENNKELNYNIKTDLEP